MQRPRLLFVLFGLAAAATAPATADDRPASGRWSTGLHYELTIAHMDGDGHESPHTIRMSGVDGRATDFSSGRRVPFPTSTNAASTADSEMVPVTSYSYQDVGLSVRLHGDVLDDGRVRVAGRIGISGLTGTAESSSRPPQVDSFDHDFHALVADGVETTVAEIPDNAGGVRVVTLTVEVGD